MEMTQIKGCTEQQASPWINIKERATATSDAQPGGNVFTAPPTRSSVSLTILISPTSLVKLNMRLL